MNEPNVLKEEKSGVLYLTLNRPDKLNALHTGLFREIDRAVAEAQQNPDIHVIVLSGAGPCFCAGHDVAVLGQAGQDEVFNTSVITRLADCDKAVVAVIHNHCYTGGLELALAADIIIAGESAKIGDTHSKFALRPVWGALQRLPRRIGVNRAKDLFFTNRVVSGSDAAAIGLADYCFPDDRLWEQAETIIQKINRNSPYSIAYMKQALRETDGQNIAAGLDRETHIDSFMGPDFEARIQVLTKK